MIEYSSQRNHLILPEYGRNIQMMVEAIKELPTLDLRNRAARSIIGVMGSMNPHLRDINDFKHKLWDHLFMMAKFDLDIDSPYPIPTEQSFAEKPSRVPYNKNLVRYRYYGKIIEKLIQKATELTDPNEKRQLISVIANHMKKSYLLWNKEMVNDDIIFKDIYELSHGKLSLDPNFRLENSKDIIAKTKIKKPDRKMNGHNMKRR